MATVDVHDTAAERLSRTHGAVEYAVAVGGIAVPAGDVAYLCKSFALTPRAVGHTTT